MRFDSKDKSGRHIIYGYLQVGEVISANPEAAFEPWMVGHPHTFEERLDRTGNTIYVARGSLSFNDKLAGYGVFVYDDPLVLTKPGGARSKWNLPDCFRAAEISYHTKNNWKDGYFQSAARGQEFVIRENDEIFKWAVSCISENALEINKREIKQDLMFL